VLEGKPIERILAEIEIISPRITHKKLKIPDLGETHITTSISVARKDFLINPSEVVGCS